MDNPRTLPPFVRGKVTGLLDFYVDEIVISKNVLLLTNNFDIVTQVQWWGEILPVCVRPKKLYVSNKFNVMNHTFTACYHSVQYEIKTTKDLLKLYLNACEVVELAVCEAAENYVIGSAFLKNLNNLLNRNDEIILMPIIDYLGEEIGQIKIHTYFFEYPKDSEKQSKLQTSKISTDSDTIESKISGSLKNCNGFLSEKTIYYNGCSKITNFEVESISDKYLKNGYSNSSLSNFEAMDLSNHISQTKESFNLPEVCVSKDSSKILTFDLKGNQKSEKNNAFKLTDKFSSNSIKYKSKPKPEKPKLGVSPIKYPKKTESTNHLTKSTKKTLTPIMVSKPTDERLDYKIPKLVNTPESNLNKRVFDYLLGSSMSKENEEGALKDFKQMSPSQEIVTSISELCVNSNESKMCPKLKHNLNFDLTNPIERNYYETFFGKNNSNDFEIAELLNEPENKTVLEKIKNDKARCKIESDCTDQMEAKNLAGLENDLISNNHCARCKYYKKLDELDTIIESLKYFEKNMLDQEKKWQFGLNGDLDKMCNR